MTQIAVQHTVKDFKKWKPFFDKHATFRMEYGMKSSRLYTDPDKPNDIMIVFDWESKYKALKFFNESNVREIMQESGVVGQPSMHFLESV